jgi:hypothetical protein
MDPTGDHICSRDCFSTKWSRSIAHTFLMQAIHSAAKLYGIDSQTEPNMCATLLGQYSEEEVKLLFPKRPSAAANTMAAHARVLELRRMELADGPERVKVTEELVNLKSKLENKVCARRIDVCLTNCKDESLLIDVAGVHPTTQSYLTPSANFVRKLAVAEDKAHDLAAPNEMLGKLSPPDPARY